MRGHVQKLPPSKTGEPRWRVVIHTTDTYLSRVVRGPRKEADAVLRAMIDEHERNTAVPGSVGELMERWMRAAHEAGKRSTNRTEADRSLLKRHAAPIMALQLRKLTPRAIEDCYSTLRKAGVGAPTIHRLHSVLSAGFNQGVKWREIASSPMSRVTTPENPRPKPRTVAVESWRAVLTDIDARLPDLAAIVRVAALTGLRTGELCGLQWDDIDLERGTIRVRRRVIRETGRVVVEEGTKTDGGRIVAASAVCVEVLRAHHERRVAMAGLVRLPMGPWVWSQDRASRTPSRPDWPGRAMRRWSDAAGRKVTMHGLRHTYASLALAAGVDVVTVAHQLGHARTSTTLDVYADHLPGGGHRAAEAVAAMLDG